MFVKLLTYIADFFLCLIIAPIGVINIAYRQMKRKQQLIKGGEKLWVLAVIFISLFGILISTPETVDNPFTYLFGGSGVLSAVLGFLLHSKGRRYAKYKDAVEKQKLYTVKGIANSLRLADETVIKDLMQMIEGGFFEDYEFDAETKALKLNSSATEKIRSRAVMCESCGARVTVIEGRQNFCEYCGTALNYR